MTESWPLHWPEGRARTPDYRREPSRFNTSFGIAVQEVLREVARLGGRLPVISTNVPLRRDGLPLANAKRITDPGVAVYFTYRDRQMCFACDRWTKVEDNIWAIAKTINAMRGIARWGTGDMLAAAFTGFTALPPSSKPWRTVLGDVRTRDDAERRYRVLALRAHPDTGGSSAAMAELNAAIEAARKELR